MLVADQTRGYLVECIPLPHQIEIGSLSLLVSGRYIHVRLVSEVGWHWPLYQYNCRHTMWSQAVTWCNWLV